MVYELWGTKPDKSKVLVKINRNMRERVLVTIEGYWRGASRMLGAYANTQEFKNLVAQNRSHSFSTDSYRVSADPVKVGRCDYYDLTFSIFDDVYAVVRVDQATLLLFLSI